MEDRILIFKETLNKLTPRNFTTELHVVTRLRTEGRKRIKSYKNFVFLRGYSLIIILLLCSCTPKTETQNKQGTITDALGRSPALSENPSRIVSLVPAVTEILFAIGAGERVVGVTQYCDFPMEAKTRTIVGGFSGATVSMEIIRSLEADLVILSADMHARVVSLLDELGIASFAVEPDNFSQVYDTIALLGEICGCADGAAKAIAEMQGKIAAVGRRIQGRERPEVFWLLNLDPLMTTGQGTFITEAIKLAGGKNVFEDINEKWPLVSPEQILLRKVDWIFYGDDMGEISLSSNGFWKLIPAVSAGRLASINADLLYRYGPRLADGVELISGMLHGE
jgi:iron complex transport system substrate-binding protein